MEKTHDLVALIELCTDYDTSFVALVGEAAVLNEYHVTGRYPGDLAFEAIGPAEAEEALAAAQQIRDRVTGT